MSFFQKLLGIYTKPHHLIMIDNREEKSGFCQYVINYWLNHYWSIDWEIEFENLEIGDVQISDDCVFEIKRITTSWNPTSKCNAHDLLSSRNDGRLWDQTEERYINFKRCIVIIQIEDDAKFFNQYFSEKEWIQINRDCILQYDQHFEYAKTHEDVFEIILQFLASSIQKKNHHDPTNKHKREKDIYDKQIYFLSGFDGVGLEMAENLLKELETPFNVIGHIIKTQITYTKTGNIKGTTSNIKGLGPQFFIKNQPILIQKTKVK